MSEQRGVLGGRPWMRAWLAVGLAAWVALGVVLVTRANNLGLVDDISISPYHVVGYAALLVLAVYVGWTFFRGLRRGAWRSAFPPLYGGLALGFVLLLGWVVLDPVWRDTLGIRPGIENGLSPTRLLIPMALVLLAAGPVREAVALRSGRGLGPNELRVRWAGVVGVGLVGAALALAAFNPVQNPAQDWAYRPTVDNAEIWTMAPDGSGQTRLLPALGDGVDYSLPAWSPDGTRIAYTVWTNNDGAKQNIGWDDQTTAIWTMASDGSDRRPVIEATDGQAWIPAWSPDGQWIAYTLSPFSVAEPGTPVANVAPGQAGPPSVKKGASIWVVRADGTDATRLSDPSLDAIGAVWSPDGTRIAYVAANAGAEAEIHVAGVNVGAPGVVPGGAPALSGDVVLAAEPANDWGPAWSPDGMTIAFVSNRSGNEDVWAVDATAAGSTTRQLTDDAAADWVPAFSPDGARIAFVSDRTGEPEIWSMAPDGSDLRNLTNHPQHFDGTWSLSWRPDGSRIAYGNSSFQDPATSGWVREDLAAAQLMLYGLMLAVLALVIVALGAPFGAFTVVLLIIVGVSAVPVDGWRFLPGAAVAGFLADVLLRSVRPALRARAAAAALPALAILGIGLTSGVAGTLAWSITLLLGVVAAAAALGWGLAEAVARLLASPAAQEHVAPVGSG